MKLSMRKITSISIAISFLVMTYTGIMLFFTPKGKIAYWTDWSLFGLTKDQYGNIHTTSMVLFVLFTALHIYYNWTPLVNYLRGKTQKISLLNGNFIVAVILNIAFVAGTLFAIPPFQTLLDFGEDIKDYWERTAGSPSYGHAEESTLARLSKDIGQDPKKALNLLKEKGLKASPDQDIETIAKENNMSPLEIYKIIKPKTSKSKIEEKITSLGRKTLGDLEEMKKIDLKKSIKYLKSKGFEADKNSRMRKAADALDMSPHELYEELENL